MADNDRWRNERERYGYRNDDRDRWQREYQDYGSRERSGGSGYGDENRFRERSGDYGRDDFRRGYRDEQRWGSGESRGERHHDEQRGGYGFESGLGGPSGSGGEYWGRRDYGAGYGRERYGQEDYGRGGREYGGRRDEQRSFWDRASDEAASWFGDDEAARRRQMDQMQGQHRGRGPKGYTRSDERVREEVCDRLTDDPMIDASEIDVSVSSCEVTLSGTVDSREAKRRAEECAERISGVKNVQNNLRVQSQAQGATTETHVDRTRSTSGLQTTGSRQKA